MKKNLYVMLFEFGGELKKDEQYLTEKQAKKIINQGFLIGYGYLRYIKKS